MFTICVYVYAGVISYVVSTTYIISVYVNFVKLYNVMYMENYGNLSFPKKNTWSHNCLVIQIDSGSICPHTIVAIR